MKHKVGEIVWVHCGHWYLYSEIIKIKIIKNKKMYYFSALKEPVEEKNVYTQEEYYKIKKEGK